MGGHSVGQRQQKKKLKGGDDTWNEIDIKLGTVHRADDFEKCFLSDQQHGMKKNMTVKKARHIKTHIFRRQTERAGVD